MRKREDRPSAGGAGEPAAVRFGFGVHGLGNLCDHFVDTHPIREGARRKMRGWAALLYE